MVVVVVQGSVPCAALFTAAREREPRQRMSYYLGTHAPISDSLLPHRHRLNLQACETSCDKQAAFDILPCRLVCEVVPTHQDSVLLPDPRLTCR